MVQRRETAPMRELERIFKALSEEVRLRILGLILRHGPVCVCEVEALLGVTQSKASRHLRYLANAGVLEAERDGVIVNYAFPRDPSPALEAVLLPLREVLSARTPDEPRHAATLVELRAERVGTSGEAEAQHASRVAETTPR